MISQSPNRAPKRGPRLQLSSLVEAIGRRCSPSEAAALLFERMRMACASLLLLFRTPASSLFSPNSHVYLRAGRAERG